MSNLPVFVIGDVHGHLDRLQALLDKAGVKEKDCVTIQLGDLGHFGGSGGSPTGDAMAWQLAREGLVDYVLWGNHDRAVIDPTHVFGGYRRPEPTVLHIMRLMEADGRLRMAFAAHGWFISHAGLHENFKDQKVPRGVDVADPGSVADWLNIQGKGTAPVIDAVGRLRGGLACCGGLLWRDIREPLYEGFPQIFGHSADSDHVVQGEQDKWHCIDIGGKGGRADPDADCLAGLWLPSQEIIRVDMNRPKETP